MLLAELDDLRRRRNAELADDLAGRVAELVRPHHARLTELAHSRGVPVMYHCDGAIYPLIPERRRVRPLQLAYLQPDTPLENVLAMYDVALRYRR